MTHPRKAYRDAVRTALSAHADLSGVEACRAWALPKNDEDLPAFTVVTRDERIDMDTRYSASRNVELAVVLKCAGGDEIEDTLDAYSETIEAVVIGVLDDWPTEIPFYQATRVLTQIEGGSKKRIGTLEIHFAITRYAGEGTQA